MHWYKEDLGAPAAVLSALSAEVSRQGMSLAGCAASRCCQIQYSAEMPAKNGWELPSYVRNARKTFLMIKGAIGTARSQFPFAIETTIGAGVG